MRGKKQKFYQQNPNLPTGEIEFEWTQDMVLNLAKCKEDLFHFAENYFYIVTLDEGKQVIELYPAQRRVMRSLVKHRRVCLLASRQIGKSTLMTIYALWIACFQPDKRILILANKEKTAIQLFDRVRLAYEMLPNWLKPGVDGAYGKTEIKLANGSSIAVSSTSGTAIRGDRANVLILDELAFVLNQVIEEFWNSVMPVISSSNKTQIFVVSTPNGTQNKFYELYTLAERGESGWHAERVDWWEVPGRSERWRKRMVDDLGSNERFDQEFGNQFIEVGQSPFSKEVFDELRASKIDPLFCFVDTPDGFEPQQGHDEFTTYRVWREAVPKHTYAIGVDVGEGVGRAASVVAVLDITDLTHIELVAMYHNRRIQPVQFATKILRIAQHFGNPNVLIERNNCGGQVVDSLYNIHQYSRIVDYSPTNPNQKYYTRLGIYSHSNAKYKGVTNMRYWFDQLQACKVYDIASIHEFETFIRHPNGTWSHQPGEHNYDDRVMAIVWALFLLEKEIAEKYLTVIEYDSTGRPARVEDPYSDTSNIDPLVLSAHRSLFGSSLSAPSVSLVGQKGNNTQMNDDMAALLAAGWVPVGNNSGGSVLF